MIEIEKNVALPERKGPGRPSEFPYRSMEIGDSFYVPGLKRLSYVRTRASVVWRESTGFRFSVRKEGDGCRVWRVE